MPLDIGGLVCTVIDLKNLRKNHCWCSFFLKWDIKCYHVQQIFQNGKLGKLKILSRSVHRQLTWIRIIVSQELDLIIYVYMCIYRFYSTLLIFSELLLCARHCSEHEVYNSELRSEKLLPTWSLYSRRKRYLLSNIIIKLHSVSEGKCSEE